MADQRPHGRVAAGEFPDNGRAVWAGRSCHKYHGGSLGLWDGPRPGYLAAWPCSRDERERPKDSPQKIFSLRRILFRVWNVLEADRQQRQSRRRCEGLLKASYVNCKETDG